MAVIFGPEDFESGSPGDFDSVGVAWGSGAASLDTTSKVEATNSILFQATGEVSARALEDLGSGYSELYMQFRGFLPTGWAFGASSYTGILLLTTSADSPVFTFNIEDYGTIRLTGNNASSGYKNTGIDIPVNSVFTLEVYVKVNGTTGRIKAWLNNTTEGSPDYDSGDINTGSTNFQKVLFGLGYAPEAHSDYYLDYMTMSTTFIGAGSSIEQEGFAFGDDDGNEASHTLDTQDTNHSGNLGTKTLRTLINATGDPASIAYKLKYQKNGSGGYSDVPVGSTTSYNTGDIESGDITQSGSNTASGSWAVSHPAASAGDLLIFNIGWDDSTNVTGLTAPSGANGETAVVVHDVLASDGTNVRGKVVYYLCTGAWSAGTKTFTPSANEQWDALVIRIPAGEFDPTTPIGGKNSLASTTAGNPSSPSVAAGSTDGGGRLVNFIVGDVDDADANATGWTNVTKHDVGAVGVTVSTRDSLVTDSESISSQTGWTFPSSRSWVSFSYIVRPPADTNNEVYISASSNVASGGEATTARLSAPSGKTTSDFDTGRRWDDENGSDTIDITADDYTELEWVLTTQSPAANSDYFDFRVYNGDSALNTYTVTPRWTISTSTNVTVEPVVQSCAFSLQSTAVTAIKNIAITATLVGIVASLLAPSVIPQTKITPDTQEATISGQSHTVTADQVLVSGTQQATLAVPAPTVTTISNTSVSPDTQTAVFATHAPIISVGVSVSSTAQTANLSDLPPNVLYDYTVSHTTQESALSLQSPTVITTQNTDIPVGSQVFTVSVPTSSIVTGSTTTVSQQGTTFSIQSPTVSTAGSVTVQPIVQDVSFSTQSHGVLLDFTSPVNVQTASFSVQTATVSAVQNVQISAGVQSGSFSSQPSSASGTANVYATGQEANFAAQSPVISISITTSSAAQGAVFSLQTVTVTTEANQTVSAGTQTLTFSTLPVQVGLSDVVEPDVLSLILSFQSPTITAFIRVYPYTSTSKYTRKTSPYTVKSPYARKTSPYTSKYPYTPFAEL